MNRKYNQKNIPKAWKKKKWRATKPGKKEKVIQIIKMRKTLPLWKRKKKPKVYGYNRIQWKLPSVLGIVSLIITILAIPTMIVFPFGNMDHSKAVTVATKKAMPSGEQETVATSDSSFSIAVMRDSSKKIEDVPLETYVARVVASEMPADFEIEALKAQALAARTYIINHILYQEEDSESDVSDTTKHQVYKNDKELRAQMKDEYEPKMEKIKKAVAATEGEIITYKDNIITPAYFSTSNGYTENAGDYWEDDIPYLQSVKSPWDTDSPKFMDQKVLTAEEVENALGVHVSGGPFTVSHTDSG